MLSNEIEQRLNDYSFYHIIEVEPGIFTKGIREFQASQEPVLKALRSLKLVGKRVIDIGCRDGLFSFEAEKAGAQDIVGIDNDISLGAKELLIPHFHSKVAMYELNVTELSSDRYGMFDVVICAGLLYHLRYPMYCLRNISSVMKEGAILILETAVFTKYDDLPLLYCPSPDDSPYESTSVAFFNIKGLEATLLSFGIRIISFSLLSTRLGRTIRRATLICERVSNAPSTMLNSYWNATHKNHSSGDPRHRPRQPDPE